MVPSGSKEYSILRNLGIQILQPIFGIVLHVIRTVRAICWASLTRWPWQRDMEAMGKNLGGAVMLFVVPKLWR